MDREDTIYTKLLVDAINTLDENAPNTLCCLNRCCNISSLVAGQYGIECEHCIYSEMFEHFSDIGDEEVESSCEILTGVGLV